MTSFRSRTLTLAAAASVSLLQACSESSTPVSTAPDIAGPRRVLTFKDYTEGPEMTATGQISEMLIIAANAASVGQVVAQSFTAPAGTSRLGAIALPVVCGSDPALANLLVRVLDGGVKGMVVNSTVVAVPHTVNGVVRNARDFHTFAVGGAAGVPIVAGRSYTIMLEMNPIVGRTPRPPRCNIPFGYPGDWYVGGRGQYRNVTTPTWVFVANNALGRGDDFPFITYVK